MCWGDPVGSSCLILYLHCIIGFGLASVQAVWGWRLGGTLCSVSVITVSNPKAHWVSQPTSFTRSGRALMAARCACGAFMEAVLGSVRARLGPARVWIPTGLQIGYELPGIQGAMLQLQVPGCAAPLKRVSMSRARRSGRLPIWITSCAMQLSSMQ